MENAISISAISQLLQRNPNNLKKWAKRQLKLAKLKEEKNYLHLYDKKGKWMDTFLGEKSARKILELSNNHNRLMSIMLSVVAQKTEI